MVRHTYKLYTWRNHDLKYYLLCLWKVQKSEYFGDYSHSLSSVIDYFQRNSLVIEVNNLFFHKSSLFK